MNDKKDNLFRILEFTLEALLCYCSDLEILQKVVVLLQGSEQDESR